MKFFLLGLLALSLLNSFQGSTIPSKKAVRAQNNDFITNFDGAYQRRDPCTDDEIETGVIKGSHKFRHDPNESSWESYTKKCTDLVTSFLRAIGNLISSGHEQSGVLNFRINASMVHSDGSCSKNIPTIVIEATEENPSCPEAGGNCRKSGYISDGQNEEPILPTVAEPDGTGLLLPQSSRPESDVYLTYTEGIGFNPTEPELTVAPYVKETIPQAEPTIDNLDESTEGESVRPLLEDQYPITPETDPVGSENHTAQQLESGPEETIEKTEKVIIDETETVETDQFEEISSDTPPSTTYVPLPENTNYQRPIDDVTLAPDHQLAFSGEEIHTASREPPSPDSYITTVGPYPPEVHEEKAPPTEAETLQASQQVESSDPELNLQEDISEPASDAVAVAPENESPSYSSEFTEQPERLDVTVYEPREGPVDQVPEVVDELSEESNEEVSRQNVFYTTVPPEFQDEIPQNEGETSQSQVTEGNPSPVDSQKTSVEYVTTPPPNPYFSEEKDFKETIDSESLVLNPEENIDLEIQPTEPQAELQNEDLAPSEESSLEPSSMIPDRPIPDESKDGPELLETESSADEMSYPLRIPSNNENSFIYTTTPNPEVATAYDDSGYDDSRLPTSRPFFPSYTTVPPNYELVQESSYVTFPPNQAPEVIPIQSVETPETQHEQPIPFNQNTEFVTTPIPETSFTQTEPTAPSPSVPEQVAQTTESVDVKVTEEETVETDPVLYDKQEPTPTTENVASITDDQTYDYFTTMIPQPENIAFYEKTETKEPEETTSDLTSDSSVQSPPGNTFESSNDSTSPTDFSAPLEEEVQSDPSLESSGILSNYNSREPSSDQPEFVVTETSPPKYAEQEDQVSYGTTIPPRYDVESMSLSKDDSSPLADEKVDQGTTEVFETDSEQVPMDVVSETDDEDLLTYDYATTPTPQEGSQNSFQTFPNEEIPPDEITTPLPPYFYVPTQAPQSEPSIHEISKPQSSVESESVSEDLGETYTTIEPTDTFPDQTDISQDFFTTMTPQPPPAPAESDLTYFPEQCDSVPRDNLTPGEIPDTSIPETSADVSVQPEAVETDVVPDNEPESLPDSLPEENSEIGETSPLPVDDRFSFISTEPPPADISSETSEDVPNLNTGTTDTYVEESQFNHYTTTPTPETVVKTKITSFNITETEVGLDEALVTFETPEVPEFGSSLSVPEETSLTETIAEEPAEEPQEVATEKGDEYSDFVTETQDNVATTEDQIPVDVAVTGPPQTPNVSDESIYDDSRLPTSRPFFPSYTTAPPDYELVQESSYVTFPPEQAPEVIPIQSIQTPEIQVVEFPEKNTQEQPIPITQNTEFVTTPVPETSFAQAEPGTTPPSIPEEVSQKPEVVDVKMTEDETVQSDSTVQDIEELSDIDPQNVGPVNTFPQGESSGFFTTIPPIEVTEVYEPVTDGNYQSQISDESPVEERPIDPAVDYSSTPQDPINPESDSLIVSELSDDVYTPQYGTTLPPVVESEQLSKPDSRDDVVADDEFAPIPANDANQGIVPQEQLLDVSTEEILPEPNYAEGTLESRAVEYPSEDMGPSSPDRYPAPEITPSPEKYSDFERQVTAPPPTYYPETIDQPTLPQENPYYDVAEVTTILPPTEFISESAEGSGMEEYPTQAQDEVTQYSDYEWGTYVSSPPPTEQATIDESSIPELPQEPGFVQPINEPQINDPQLDTEITNSQERPNVGHFIPESDSNTYQPDYSALVPDQTTLSTESGRN